MILKKPYAFLIKYFKLINFILSGLICFLLFKIYNIVIFFNDHISQNYVGNYYAGFRLEYVNIWVYLAIVIILALLIAIYFLFTYKNKPKKIYIYGIIYFIGLIIYLQFVKNIMIQLEDTIITAEITRIYRDVSIIMLVLPVPLFINYLIRGFGLNLNKFNFKEDLKELEIEEQDNEEIEIVLKGDGYKLQRNIKRFFREFRYYLKENKFIFGILSLVFIILVGLFIYNLFPDVVDSKYNQGDSFVINNIKYSIEDSIITSLDANGNIITDNYYYLVVRLHVDNNTNKSMKFDYNNFRLQLDDEYIYPSLDKGKYFVDYAKDYYSNEIKANSSGIHSIVYKVKESELRKNYKIKIFSGNKFSDEGIVGSHHYISISPIIISKIDTVDTVSQNEKLVLSSSNLGDTEILLSNAIITEKYLYKYKNCINEICNEYVDVVNVDYTKNDKILIVMNYEYKLDEKTPFAKTSKSIDGFINSFIKVKYKAGEEYKYAKARSVTPSKLTNQIVIETTDEIRNSEELFVAIIIRNKEYLVKLK